MAQPKQPPISIRLPLFLIARLETWAAEHKTTRNGAIVQFIEAGLVEPVVIEPPKPEAAAKLMARPAPKREGPPKLVEPAGGRVALPLGPQAFVSRLKNR